MPRRFCVLAAPVIVISTRTHREVRIYHRTMMLATLLVIGSAAPLLSQEAKDRPFIDSLFAGMAQAKSIGEVPAFARCGTVTGSLGRLCEGLLLTRRAEFSGLAEEANRAEGLLRRTVEEKSGWPIAWYGLGVARLELARLKVLAREGPRQSTGLSWVVGATASLVRALELDTTLIGAAEALAMAPLPREGVSRVGDRLAMLKRLRNSLPLSPSSRLAIGRLEREAGSPDTAAVLLGEAMARGADSGVALLEMSRALHKAGRPVEGSAVLFAGAAATTTPESQRRYREELLWVTSPAEIAKWDSTPAPERQAWLASFWATRDVKEGREPGERLGEHYRRLELAMKEFQITVPQVGRQKVRSVAFAIDGLAETVPGAVSSDAATPTAEEADAAANMASSDAFSSTLGLDVPFRIFQVTQDLMDDRGLVWIRHGKPDLRTSTVGGTPLEAWLYRRPEGDLVLYFAEANFDGTSGASVLVPTVTGASAEAINQLCASGLGLCDRLQADGIAVARGAGQNGRQQPRGATEARVSPEAKRNERDAGREQIARAVTTDAFPRRFEEALDPITQIYGLDRASGGAPRLVVAFAIPGEKLAYTTPADAGGRTIYSVRVRILSVDQETGFRTESDSLRHFATAAPLQSGQFLTGVAELRVPAGRYTTTLVLSQDGGKGALSRLATVQAPSLKGLQISDVVLGREGSGVWWSSGPSRVAMNPLNAYAKGAEAELYYQLGGLKVGASYVTRFEFFASAEPDAPAKLSVGFTATAESDRAEVLRTIGLENLEPGSYTLRVTVAGNGSEVRASARLVIVKK